MRIPLAVHSYQSRSLPLSAQRLLNLYPQTTPPDAKSKVVLFGTPGLNLFSTAGTGPIRGSQFMAGLLYVVSGTEVYSVTSGGTASLLGSVTGTGDVSIANNGTQMVVVCSDTKGYVVTSSSVVEITDIDWPGASIVTYQDGYFVFSQPSTGRFFLSAINDGSDYDSLDYATAEGDPDNTVAVISDHRELWVFGETSVEVWTNTGDASFPFERLPGAFLERGCGGAFTVAKTDNTVLWLGNDKVVYRADGYVPIRVSTHAIEYAISAYTSAPRAWTYSQEGHSFYILSYDEGTWVLDLSTGFWHERESDGLTRWRASCGAYGYSKNLVGDYSNGKIYELDLDYYSDDGGSISRQAVSPPIHAEGMRAFMSRFEVEFEAGTGLVSGQGVDPQAMLQWSDDGGRTWSNEHWRDMGLIGQYNARTVWNRLGSFRQRFVRLTISDPIKVVIIAANTNITGGT